MANGLMILRCRYCGEEFVLAKHWMNDWCAMPEKAALYDWMWKHSPVWNHADFPESDERDQYEMFDLVYR